MTPEFHERLIQLWWREGLQTEALIKQAFIEDSINELEFESLLDCLLNAERVPEYRYYAEGPSKRAIEMDIARRMKSAVN